MAVQEITRFVDPEMGRPGEDVGLWKTEKIGGESISRTDGLIHILIWLA
jgi:hypothetical protein